MSMKRDRKAISCLQSIGMMINETQITNLVMIGNHLPKSCFIFTIFFIEK